VSPRTFTRASAADRRARLLDLLADDTLTTRQLARLAQHGEASTANYLRQLEAQGVVTSRLETPDDARRRIAHEPRSVFAPRYARRQLLWTLTEKEQRAA